MIVYAIRRRNSDRYIIHLERNRFAAEPLANRLPKLFNTKKEALRWMRRWVRGSEYIKHDILGRPYKMKSYLDWRRAGDVEIVEMELKPNESGKVDLQQLPTLAPVSWKGKRRAANG